MSRSVLPFPYAKVSIAAHHRGLRAEHPRHGDDRLSPGRERGWLERKPDGNLDVRQGSVDGFRAIQGAGARPTA